MTNTTPSLPRIPSPCRAPGCHVLTTTGRCPTHSAQQNAEHRTRTAYYHTPEWRALRKRCLEMAYGMCVICAASGPDVRLTAHHIKARKDGGPDTLDNLACVCHRCHNRIENSDPAYLRRLGEWVRATRGDKP